MNYAEMSDAQIAEAVFKAAYDGTPDFKESPCGGIVIIGYEHDIIDGEDVEMEVEYGIFNPCNNPADIWPLIVESEISILVGKECSAFAFHKVNRDAEDRPCGYDFSFSCKNALRAAAIVYLMMKEAGK
ncbi:DUF2591 domain-containing protein [Edwardsiella tarda]|uniref:phage protein NinX family protein n=1 Tax=Edwardsiella tarda TaxID=636 RepID=UPI00351C89BF